MNELEVRNNSQVVVIGIPEIVHPFYANQGKRLIKRLRKIGVAPGSEFDFLLGLIKSGASTFAVSKAREEGLDTDAAMGRAMVAMSGVVAPTRSDHVGLDLARLLMENGAAPGRLKLTLDFLLTEQARLSNV